MQKCTHAAHPPNQTHTADPPEEACPPVLCALALAGPPPETEVALAEAGAALANAVLVLEACCTEGAREAEGAAKAT